MYDFLKVTTKYKNGRTIVYPKFIVLSHSNDLMIRGKDFYAIWDPATNMWSKDEGTAITNIDAEIQKYYDKIHKADENTTAEYMWDSDSGSIDRWHKYCQKQMRDYWHQLDGSVIFANTPVTKRDYASKRLPYNLEDGDISSYDTLMNTLYSESEREKIDWAIGSIVAGDSKRIQKFIALYGDKGTGKSTVINIIQKMFGDYCTVFNAKDLANANAAFALEAFKDNPLVAIQHDADLSRIDDNTKLNSIASHEEMEINEKFKSKYKSRFSAMMFIGTNEMVKITDAKSGLVRRLIDVQPTGNKLPITEYDKIIDDIYENELGHIAKYCLDLYNRLGKNYYENYIPIAMIRGTNDFYNFIQDNYLQFTENDPVTLSTVWIWYKEYAENANLKYVMNKTRFRSELQNYYLFFDERTYIDGHRMRSVYSGFKKEKFDIDENKTENLVPRPNETTWIHLEKQKSIFDDTFKDCPAQYANQKQTPTKKWSDVTTTLKDLDTSKLHYVKVPENLIVIDFDIKDADGNKASGLNIEAATKFPRTYAEYSKSGDGIHLHYFYSGDVSELSRVFDDNIEVKVFTGNSSLRRLLTKCNDLPIATMEPGFLPTKGGKAKMIDWDGVKNEKMLRTMVIKNLRKEYHANTKPSVDYISKLLNEAYENGIDYDLSDMKSDVMAFCAKSTHNKDYCLKAFKDMKFRAKKYETEPASSGSDSYSESQPIVIFDIEVMPNRFGIVYKPLGKSAVKIPNPTVEDVEYLTHMKLVGFNCRRYDNHILYAKLLGYSQEQLYELSKRIVEGDMNVFFGPAYNLSYADIYDFSSKKQSLKKFEIELGINHLENHYRWDQPVTDKQWAEIIDYCENDVVATEAVWNDRQADFEAREILTELANISATNVHSVVNDTTNTLTGRIIFQNNSKPQDQFIYTDLSTGVSYHYGDEMPKKQRHDDPLKDSLEIAKQHPIEEEWKKGNFNCFPGYIFQDGKSYYMGELVGEGGYVYSDPGSYVFAETQDVMSMHPSDAIRMNIFGDKYTSRFNELLQLRVAIKHKDYDKARTMFGGALSKYLGDDKSAKKLSKALKIAINSVYGLTSAKFTNKFKDPRNDDNIVAKRGALIMITLKNKLLKEGVHVIHVKTDSIKVAGMTDDIRNEIREYEKMYGLTFETEHAFDKICLVNDAVFIGKLSKDDPEDPGKWLATGTQFQVPYVFKTLFSHEKIVFDDMCETKSATTALYLDHNENLPEGEHNYEFIGKVGRFTPIQPGKGGGLLLRENNGKFAFATGSKGYRWMESSKVKELGLEKYIDKRYYQALVDDAIAEISKYCDIEWFVSDDSTPF